MSLFVDFGASIRSHLLSKISTSFTLNVTLNNKLYNFSFYNKTLLLFFLVCREILFFYRAKRQKSLRNTGLIPLSHWHSLGSKDIANILLLFGAFSHYLNLILRFVISLSFFRLYLQGTSSINFSFSRLMTTMQQGPA